MSGSHLLPLLAVSRPARSVTGIWMSDAIRVGLLGECPERAEHDRTWKEGSQGRRELPIADCRLPNGEICDLQFAIDRKRPHGPFLQSQIANLKLEILFIRQSAIGSRQCPG